MRIVVLLAWCAEEARSTRLRQISLRVAQALFELTAGDGARPRARIVFLVAIIFMAQAENTGRLIPGFNCNANCYSIRGIFSDFRRIQRIILLVFVSALGEKSGHSNRPPIASLCGLLHRQRSCIEQVDHAAQVMKLLRAPFLDQGPDQPH